MESTRTDYLKFGSMISGLSRAWVSVYRSSENVPISGSRIIEPVHMFSDWIISVLTDRKLRTSASWFHRCFDKILTSFRVCLPEKEEKRQEYYFLEHERWI